MSTSSIVQIAAGSRMPAEWEPHAATWLSWPHNTDTWPTCLAAVERAMVQIVTALAKSELVRINVLDSAHELHVRRLLSAEASLDAVVFHAIRTNDAWIRDHGAIILESGHPDGKLLAVDFEYNAWGDKYPPYDLDQRVASQMAEVLGIDRIEPGLVLEGGSIDVNGAGALLTTSQCLLNENRNRHLSKDDIAQTLKQVFGVDQIIWLGVGIAGDDTDGHIDDVTRFVAEDTVVTAIEPNIEDVNYRALATNLEMLESVELAPSGKLNVIELPMPEPQMGRPGRLPASYANFYVANQVVLLPVFGCPQDQVAVSVLQECFADRTIVPIDSRALVEGLGAVHCLTQQVPVVKRRPEAIVAAHVIT